MGTTLDFLTMVFYYLNLGNPVMWLDALVPPQGSFNHVGAPTLRLPALLE